MGRRKIKSFNCGANRRVKSMETIEMDQVIFGFDFIVNVSRVWRRNNGTPEMEEKGKQVQYATAQIGHLQRLACDCNAARTQLVAFSPKHAPDAHLCVWCTRCPF